MSTTKMPPGIPGRRKGGPRRGPAAIPPERWRNPAFLAFLREYGRCAVLGCRRSGCDPAHGPVNGRGSKGPDAEAIPLCRGHHENQTSMRWPQFEEQFGVDRAREAAIWWLAFTIMQEHTR